MEQWNNGTGTGKMEQWNKGTMEKEQCNNGTGTMEHWNNGTIEQYSNGTMQQ